MEILSKTEYYSFHPILGIFCLIIGIAFLGLVVAMIIEAFKKEEYALIPISLFFIVLAVVLFLGYNTSLDREMVYEYKVIITDFNEVYEKGYEVTDQNGKIYTVTKHGK